MDHKAEHQQRCAIVIELLDNWRNFYDEPASIIGDGISSTGDVDRPMPETWTLFSTMGRWPAVVELRRCLELRQRQSPGHYKHLVAYSIKAEWRLIDKPIKVRNAHGKWVEKMDRVKERVVPRWISPRMVELAVIGIVFDWDRKVPLTLPPAMTRRLGEFTDQHGTHVTERAA